MAAALDREVALDALGMFRAIYDFRPSSTTYQNVSEAIQASGGLVPLAVEWSKSLTQGSSDGFADLVLAHVGIAATTLGGGNPAESFSLVRNALSELGTVHANSRAVIVHNLVNVLQTLDQNSVYGAAAREFNSKVLADYAALTGQAVEQGPTVAVVGVPMEATSW